MHFCRENGCHTLATDILMHGQELILEAMHDIPKIIKGLEKLVTASDDLKTAVTANDATVEGAIAAIVAYLKDIAGQVSGGLSDTDAEALAADLNQHASDLQAATANLTAADPGAPVTTDPTDPTDPTQGQLV